MRYLLALLVSLLLSCVAVAADAPSDDQIYDKVRITLANDQVIKGGAIEVKVSNGVVELNGFVKLEKQRLKAEKTARKVKGVQKVINNLKVSTD